jgi:hypothetical protein
LSLQSYKLVFWSGVHNSVLIVLNIIWSPFYLKKSVIASLVSFIAPMQEPIEQEIPQSKKKGKKRHSSKMDSGNRNCGGKRFTRDIRLAGHQRVSFVPVSG